MAQPAIEQVTSKPLEGKESGVSNKKVLSVVNGTVESKNLPSQPQENGAPSLIKEYFPRVEGSYVLLHPGVAAPTTVQAVQEHDQMVCRGQDGSRFTEILEGQIFVGPIESVGDERAIREASLRPVVPVSTDLEDNLEAELNDVYGKLDRTERELDLLKKEQEDNPLKEKMLSLKLLLDKAEGRIQDLQQRASVSEEELEVSLKENDTLKKEIQSVKDKLHSVQVEAKSEGENALTGAQRNALANIKTLLMHAKMSSQSERGREVFQGYIDQLDS